MRIPIGQRVDVRKLCPASSVARVVPGAAIGGVGDAGHAADHVRNRRYFVRRSESIFSAISTASSASMPRYLTVLSGPEQLLVVNQLTLPLEQNATGKRS